MPFAVPLYPAQSASAWQALVVRVPLDPLPVTLPAHEVVQVLLADPVPLPAWLMTQQMAAAAEQSCGPVQALVVTLPSAPGPGPVERSGRPGCGPLPSTPGDAMSAATLA